MDTYRSLHPAFQGNILVYSTFTNISHKKVLKMFKLSVSYRPHSLITIQLCYKLIKI